MDLIALLANVAADPLSLAPLFAAASAAAVVAAIFWPMIERRRKTVRLHHVFQAERRMRERAARDRQEKREDDVVSLRYARPKRFYSAIVEQLHLGKLLRNEDMRKQIYRAGFRSPAAATQFIAIRVIAAAALPVLIEIYLPIVLDVDMPIWARLPTALLAAAAGWYAPMVYLKNKVDNRRTEVRRSWPDAMDLLLICVESGMSIEASFRKVADEIATQSLVLSEELSLTTAELSYLQDRRKAYRRLAARTDVEEVRAVATSLIQSERYGTSVGQALRVLSKESRSLRMAAAEKKAAALPPKLTVPMILFFLPVLFAVIMTPAIIQIVQD